MLRVVVVVVAALVVSILFTCRNAKCAAVASFVMYLPLHFSASVRGAAKSSFSLFSSLANASSCGAFDFRRLLVQSW